MEDYIWSEWIKIDDKLMEKPKELQYIRDIDFEYQCKNFTPIPYTGTGTGATHWDRSSYESDRITHYRYKIFHNKDVESLSEPKTTVQNNDNHTYKITWRIAEQEMIVETTDRDFIKEVSNDK